MELYLIRHGQSTNNATNEVDRVADPALTEAGHKQAEAVAQYLKYGRSLVDPGANHNGFGITKLYCSPMLRTLQTAQPISKALGLKPEVWIEIHEHGGIFLDFRDERGVVGYPGLSRSEILKDFADYSLPETLQENGWWDAMQGEEAITGAQARAIKVAAALREQAGSSERIALVTHGTFMDCLVKALLHQLPSNHHYFGHNNTGITRFDFYNQKPTELHFMGQERIILRYMNRIDHLTPELVT
jgi:2,3-bisphosphoglycerate-dependent phosphoglycerate mutase